MFAVPAYQWPQALDLANSVARLRGRRMQVRRGYYGVWSRPVWLVCEAGS